ncbi:MAG TPA: ThiF family adenylyltransferase [Candidatus Methylomirabilis sp.]|nr:ThiF family adenylyltransferase [Candidatus Methylomirabilis sp.]
MDFSRQTDLVEAEALETPVTMIGCGGIGSFSALALAKMGCVHLTVYDDDRVEEHNIPNQLYRPSDVGQLKVTCLADIIKSFTGAGIDVRPERVQAQRLRGIVVSGVDSMEARQRIWERAIKYRAGVAAYIDARMGAEVARIYTVRPVDPDHVRLYERTLYSDDDALHVPCTAQAIVYNGFGIAGLVAGQVKRIVMGEACPFEIIFDQRTLTFLTA